MLYIIGVLFTLFAVSVYFLLAISTLKDLKKKRTIPAMSEIDIQFNQEILVSNLPKGKVRNSHWFKHTFERPTRRK